MQSKSIQFKGIAFLNKSNTAVLSNSVYAITLSIVVFLGITDRLFGVTIFELAFKLLAAVSFVLIFNLKEKERAVFLFLWPLFLLVGSLVNNFHYIDQQAFNLFGVIGFAHVGMALLIYSTRNIEKLFLIVLYFVSAYCLLMWLLGVDGNDWFVRGSRNHVSIILISLCSIYYLLEYKSKNKVVSITPVFITFMSCVLAVGRAGVITGFLLLIIVLIKKYSDKFKYLSIKILTIFIALLIVLGLIAFFFEEITMGFTQRDGFDTPRWFIWSVFITEILSGYNYIFGIPVDRIITLTGYTVHNGFFDIISRAGIFGAILTVLMLIAIARVMLVSWFVGGIGFVLILRTLVDNPLGDVWMGSAIFLIIIHGHYLRFKNKVKSMN